MIVRSIRGWVVELAVAGSVFAVWAAIDAPVQTAAAAMVAMIFFTRALLLLGKV
jgi:hypothetical protein